MSMDISVLIQSFVEDCREHLDSIEAALMDIEAAGAHQNPELVNSVFRLAHSIKGGAGMLGLDNIKALAHQLENVLHMVRSNELTPTHEVVEVLLKGFDRLTHLVDNIEDSENLSIDAQVARLLALTEGPEEPVPTEPPTARFSLGADVSLSVDARSLEQARKGGNELYVLEFDLIHDIHGKGRLPLDVLKALTDTGRIVDCKVDFAAVGDLEAFGNSIPFYLLYATILEPAYVTGLVKLPPERVRHITELPEAIAPAVPQGLEESFGPLRLTGDTTAGLIVLPEALSPQALSGLHAALLAGLERCEAVTLDLEAVERCDLFFLQLLLSAGRSFAARGKRLCAKGALAPDLDREREVQGFVPLTELCGPC